MTKIYLTGTLTCPDEDIAVVRAALPDHIRLTRAEPGCLSFDIIETVPGTYKVDEIFANRAAFEAHQTRTRASDWYRITGQMARDFAVTEK
ncbi:putative quinol monooxygenase [Puniceibacterium sp. IMCC21224]|uniref:putative quinol monooxygenase n=1 Tax=Puniceibacterium sp. IMCC21224 TaxID=1618204 RepID=UPI00064DE9F6|nr:antibiotic biosynthesis monooxygenase [Puniceibacterium sp. IMCC21224]KMK66888.1 hypothetical protein IMCC21224_111747 [Puniceibacterium sp. IMCC21224]